MTVRLLVVKWILSLQRNGSVRPRFDSRVLCCTPAVKTHTLRDSVLRRKLLHPPRSLLKLLLRCPWRQDRMSLLGWSKDGRGERWWRQAGLSICLKLLNYRTCVCVYAFVHSFIHSFIQSFYVYSGVTTLQHIVIFSFTYFLYYYERCTAQRVKWWLLVGWPDCNSRQKQDLSARITLGVSCWKELKLFPWGCV
jgi:hypothetical protein